MTVAGSTTVVAVGVDLGGTATRFVTLDSHNVIRARVIVGTPSDGSPASAVTFLAGNIDAVVGDDTIRSIGIGASGPIDLSGIIRNVETLPAFSDIDLRAELARRFELRATIDNDAVTAAVGEYVVGAGRGCDDLLMITLGTGVGVSLLHNGLPFRNAAGEHPEASHLSLTGPPARCYCGRSSCWEQLASRSALQAASSELFADARHTSEDIDRSATSADAGDPAAVRVFTDFGERLGEGMADLISVYQPRVVVLGGSGSRYLPRFGAALRSTLDALLGANSVELREAQLGEFGGAIGAALNR